MTPAELKAKLAELLKLPAETEWVEFKEAKSNLDSDDLGKYFAALCNEANLKDQPVGWLVFGVQDKPRKVVGSQYRPHRASLDSLKQETAQHTTSRITFKGIHELHLPEGRVVMFEIPPAPQGIPVAWKGHFYGRDAHALGALNIQEIEQIRAQSGHQDWSAQPCPSASITDLDPAALALAREKFRQKNRNRLLAEAMVSLDMIDALGMGIKRMFLAQRNRYFPLPEYDFSQPDAVRMEIMGRLIDENYSRVLIEKADLDLGTVVALDKVQKRKPLIPEELKHLRRLKLVEGRAPNVFVASKIAAITGDKAQYIRNRAFDTQHYKQMILDFIREFGSASRKDIDDLLRGKLSDVLTPDQQAVRIKNLLAIMVRKDKTIINSGSKKKPNWLLKNKDTTSKKNL